jgi:hypothetical protein
MCVYKKDHIKGNRTTGKRDIMDAIISGITGVVFITFNRRISSVE